MSNFQDSVSCQYRISICDSQENIDHERIFFLYHDKMEIKVWVKTARTSAELTQEQLGDMLGLTKGNVSGWENGRHEPSWSQMLRISDITNYPLPIPSDTKIAQQSASGLLSLAGDELEEAPDLRAFEDVPVVGTVQGGDDGYLLEFEYPVGHGDGRITYPRRDKNSYALRVRGDSMRPRIKSGEFIVIEPNYEYSPGDEVVVALKNGKRMVKELLYQRDGEISLGSINNGHPNITVSLEDVEKVHYVAAIIPRGAFYKDDKAPPFPEDFILEF